jgi:hypothetical protein
MAVVAAALSLALATGAGAQPGPAFTVTFGGPLRVAGIAFDNPRDFENTDDISFGHPLDNDATGTWGIGGSVTTGTIPRALDASAPLASIGADRALRGRRRMR